MVVQIVNLVVNLVNLILKTVDLASKLCIRLCCCFVHMTSVACLSILEEGSLLRLFLSFLPFSLLNCLFWEILVIRTKGLRTESVAVQIVEPFETKCDF